MSEQKLTDDQLRRIDQIKEQWMRDIENQVDTIPESEGRVLDGKRTMAYLRLERKYKPMIDNILDESNV